MIVRELHQWPNEPFFAAAGNHMLPADVGVLEHAARLVTVEGEALHTPTGRRLVPGTVAEFEPGEALDLVVTKDMKFWLYEVRAE